VKILILHVTGSYLKNCVKIMCKNVERGGERERERERERETKISLLKDNYERL